MPSVLITSASRGLGFEFARQYANDSWKVFAACRDPQASDRLQGLKKKRRNQNPADGRNKLRERQQSGRGN